MCEREYVACSHCGTPANELRYYTVGALTEYATLDDDGDIVDWCESESGEQHESGYDCPQCGVTDLDHAYVDPDCDCRECDPATAIAEPQDPNAWVLIRRNAGAEPKCFTCLEDEPPEMRLLFSDRAITAIKMRAERLAEIADAFEDELFCRIVLDPHECALECVPHVPEPEEAIAA